MGLHTTSIPEKEPEPKDREFLGEREAVPKVHRQVAGTLFTLKVAGYSLYTLVC